MHCAVSCSYITVAYVATMYITYIHVQLFFYSQRIFLFEVFYFNILFILNEQASAIRYLFFYSMSLHTYFSMPRGCSGVFVCCFSNHRGCNVSVCNFLSLEAATLVHVFF